MSTHTVGKKLSKRPLSEPGPAAARAEPHVVTMNIGACGLERDASQRVKKQLSEDLVQIVKQVLVL